MKKLPLCFALLFAARIAIAADAQDGKLVVHEWGTFTSLQDEQGNAIAGINSDDEPVPAFVHRLAAGLLVPANTLFNTFQGAPRCHPDVTMRLETPVIYFYPPAGARSGPVDVTVSFLGGWLTEFYPDAVFKAPGFDGEHPAQVYSNEAAKDNTAAFGHPFSIFGHIHPELTGELAWRRVTFAANQPMPETAEKVWLAPRDVKATSVTASNGESEKFLFYRGVGKADAPLHIVRNDTNKTLEIHDNRFVFQKEVAGKKSRHIPAAWLVDVKADGTCAFKSVGELEWGEKIRGVMPASFAANDYAEKNMPLLRDEMHRELVRASLFADEAAALLNTWEISYFKSPGLRFFYLCPRADIEERLSLKISVPCELTRVMVGRIEIVTPEQRAALKKIANDKNTAAEEEALYSSLGRFRNALVLDEQKRHPTEQLYKFILSGGLSGYQIDQAPNQSLP